MAPLPVAALINRMSWVLRSPCKAPGTKLVTRPPVYSTMGWMNWGTPGCAAQTVVRTGSRQRTEHRRVRLESDMGTGPEAKGALRTQSIYHAQPRFTRRFARTGAQPEGGISAGCAAHGDAPKARFAELRPSLRSCPSVRYGRMLMSGAFDFDRSERDAPARLDASKARRRGTLPRGTGADDSRTSAARQLHS